VDAAQQAALRLPAGAGVERRVRDARPAAVRRDGPRRRCLLREIPADIDAHRLIETHRSEWFDHTGIRADPNLAFPVDRARELVARGRIGAVNHRHLSFMGSITAPGRLIRDTAPEAARQLVSDGVDIALLIPV